MFKRKYRLPKKYFRGERTLYSSLYTLKLAKNGKKASRFGFVISKKIDKRATVRNRIKREFRKCIEDKIDQIVVGYDFLFILKTGNQENNFCNIIYSQFEKEGLFK